MARNNDIMSSNTAAWRILVWLMFLSAFGSTVLGVVFMPVEIWVKGYIGMGVLFTVGSSFTLAKTVRDDHEQSKVINRITAAKTEKILQDFEREVT